MSRSRALLLSALALLASLWLAAAPRVEAEAGRQADVSVSCTPASGFCTTALGPAKWSERSGRGGVLASLPVALEDGEGDPPDALAVSGERPGPFARAAPKPDRSALADALRRTELPLSTGPPGA